MAARRRKQRTRILVACEGASERGYGRWLQSILDSLEYYVHIESWLPGRGGGDYLSLVEESISHINREKRRDRPYKITAILLDTTQKGNNRQRDVKAENDGLRIKNLPIMRRWIYCMRSRSICNDYYFHKRTDTDESKG